MVDDSQCLLSTSCFSLEEEEKRNAGTGARSTRESRGANCEAMRLMNADLHPGSPFLIYGMAVAGVKTRDILLELRVIKEERELLMAALLIEIHICEDKETSLKLISNLEYEEEDASDEMLIQAAVDLNADLVGAASQNFDKVLGVKHTCLDAMLGKAACFEFMEEYTRAMYELDQAALLYPWFYPATCEKARVGMLVQDWDCIYESSQEVLQKDPENIDALRLQTHFLLCKNNSTVTSMYLLGNLVRNVCQKEPRNARLYIEFAQPIARLAGRGSPGVLNHTLSLVEKSQVLAPNNGIYLLEMAKEFFLLGDYSAAISRFRLASQMEDVKTEATNGVIQCLLILKNLDDASKLLQSVDGTSSFVFYLKAQQSWLENRHEACWEFLNGALELHLKSTRIRRDYQFYTEIDPDMILGAGHLYLALFAKCTTRNGTVSLTRQIAALELLLSAAPGFVNAHVMLARTHMELGDLEVSQESLQTALLLDSTCACAYILLAQVLESAIILPSMNRDSEKLEYYSTQGKMLMDESSANKVMLYFLLAKMQIKMQNFAEAEKTIDDASRLFSGLHEKALVEVARAVLFVAKGKIDLGIEILHHIPCDSHCLIEARTAMAHIYLEHKGDKMRFLQCFSELAELFPSAKMHLKLADAFNKVNDPIRAMKSLESALKNSPNDASIIKKLGNALITCHEYQRAKVCQENNDLDSAILFLSETLNDCPAHTSALLLLSNIHLVRGELSECEVNCANLLKVDMTSSDGGKLLILVLLQREMYDAALSSMQQLLQRDPTCYIVLEQLFNYARSDAKWGKRALLAMIEIYSHIDDELFHDEENLEFTVPYVKVEDGDAEAALVKINKAAAREKDHVLLMLCRAVALMILNQTGKAKAELRSIDRLTYKWNEGINFERAWLMLAQTYLQAGKLDVAEQLCRKCISYNRSSSKAWEFLGVAMERGNAYTEAANFYQCAWKHQRGSSLTVGYKLARVYLKLKRYMDAIAICQAVMQLFPNSIKIRRDVLDKARKCIRF
ncbi:tetratricopeptide repeat protein 21B [Selaginella moellendorffii]|uniref:tetratricopeptide repeat protein 21B n=1 Tax=Selaginella moellendorffii TaxID=88036 RepID=UPI000D1C8689|nr:tetratricopeptide repeat protein 21B [Selaginella moellendorffii]|eukprot:XP_024530434.1 tetratricopeptide repeat protein 21B [Selaginella moellendorffii]